MAEIKKSSIKKGTRGMLMGRGALEKFKDLIQTIKSEEGIDFGDDEGFDTLLEFYMNCVEEYNAMTDGEGPQFYASTKKSKSKIDKKGMMYQLNPEDINLIFNFSATGSHSMYEDGIHFDVKATYMDEDLGDWKSGRMDGETGFETKIGDFRFAPVDLIDPNLILSWQNLAVREIQEKINRRNESGEYSYKPYEMPYEASTKKSKVKKSTPDVKMSFEQNVNKMRMNNYAKTGNINTVMKKRD